MGRNAQRIALRDPPFIPPHSQEMIGGKEGKKCLAVIPDC